MSNEIHIIVTMPNDLYDLITEMAKEQEKDWNSVVLDALYLHVLCDKRINKAGARKENVK